MLNVIIRQLSPKSTKMAARLYNDGKLVRYTPTCPYQGTGETAEEALARLFLGWGGELGLTSCLTKPTKEEEAVLAFGRALMNSASDTRNFQIQVESDGIWPDSN